MADSLAHLLYTKAKDQLSDADGPFSKIVRPSDLFHAFMKSNIEYKGLMCSGYSNQGWAAELTLQIDFGEWLFPCATASVKAGGGGAHTRYLLMVIARMPRTLGKYRTDHPIALQCLLGSQNKWKVSLGAEVGFKTPALPKTNFLECVSLTCEAKATAQANVSYEGFRLLVRDPNPRFYASINDQALQRDFSGLIGPGKKSDIKEEVETFFKSNKELTHLLPEKGWWKRVRGAGIKTDDLRTALAQAKTSVLTARFSQKQRQEMLNAISFLDLKLTERKTHSGSLSLESRKSDALASLLESSRASMPKEIMPFDSESSIAAIAENMMAESSALCFLDMWCHNPAADASVGISAEISASIGPHVGDESGNLAPLVDAALGKPEGPEDPNAEKKVKQLKLAEVGVADELRAGISGSYKRTSYRYQTFSRPEGWDPPLVYTQDTVITYSQVLLKLTGKIELKRSVLGHDVGPESETLKELGDLTLAKKQLSNKSAFQGMSYSSAMVYWRYPIRPYAETEVFAEVGSGYAYGQTVVVETLLGHTRRFTANGRKKGVWQTPPKEANDYLTSVARALRVSVNDLVECLLDANGALKAVPFGDKPADGRPVLIEAAFAVPAPGGAPFRAKLEKPSRDKPARLAGDSLTTKSFRRTMIELGDNAKEHDGAHPNLQAIRIRRRIADVMDESATKFKLGFKIGDTQAGIELKKIDEAGSEGIVDVYTRWFYPYEGYNQGGTYATLGHEAGIPPVALLHQ
jgi:hypothetical protein